ncbi:hypothetical protein [Nocardioides taihuensis]|uniref:ABC transporter n=1 Tax=Nocardioides taihuensis TaxID=1835606 RepID=A0ABW0BKS8_9ACTN
MNAWLAPTARATSWGALAVVGLAVAALGAGAAYDGRWPGGLLGVMAGVLAAAVVTGLRDPAENLLAAVPTSAAVRRARRLALLLPVAAVVWVAYLWPGHDLVPGLGWPLGPAAALVATGVAVCAWAPAGRGVAAGVAAPLLWVAAARVVGDTDGLAGDVLLAWQAHPWTVTAAATAALMTARDR